MNLKFLKYSSIILILSCFNLSFAQGYVFEDVDYAENYDSYSKLQKDVLNELLYLFSQEFKDSKREKSLLELGSGTGESFKMISKKLWTILELNS